MKSSWKTTIRLLVATLLALSPAQVFAAYELPTSDAPGPCDTSSTDSCTDQACSDQICSDTADQEDDSCCEADCQHCGLPCCSGIAMITSATQRLDSSLTVTSYLPTLASNVTWIDANPLYHPPRG